MPLETEVSGGLEDRTSSIAAQMEEGGNDFAEQGDEGSSISAADTSPAPQSGETSQESGTPASPAAPTAPADPNQAAARAAAQGQTTPNPADNGGWTSVYEAVRGLGVALPETVQDDHQTLLYFARLAQQAQQQDVYTQLGRQLAPRAREVQQFLEQQRAQQQPQQPEPWKPPPFDERWLSVVEANPETGLFVAKQPGVPQEIVDGVNAFADYQRKFQRDPIGTIEPYINQRVSEGVQQALREYQQQQRQQQVISDIERRHGGWLYSRDNAQQIQRDPQSGQPILSPAGQRYAYYVQQAQRIGINDVRAQDEYAFAKTQADFYAAQYTQQAQTQQTQADPQTQQARTAPSVNPAGAAPPSERVNNPFAQPPTGTGRSLRDMLRAGLREFQDADFADAGM